MRWTPGTEGLPDKLNGIHYRFIQSKDPIPYRSVSKSESWGNIWLRFYCGIHDIKNYTAKEIEWLNESEGDTSIKELVEALMKMLLYYGENIELDDMNDPRAVTYNEAFELLNKYKDK